MPTPPPHLVLKFRPGRNSNELVATCSEDIFAGLGKNRAERLSTGFANVVGIAGIVYDDRYLTFTLSPNVAQPYGVALRIRTHLELTLHRNVDINTDELARTSRNRAPAV